MIWTNAEGRDDELVGLDWIWGDLGCDGGRIDLLHLTAYSGAVGDFLGRCRVLVFCGGWVEWNRARDYRRVLGAKRYGATAWGMVGAMLGGVVGLFLGFLGIILGPFVGAVLAEVLAGREWQKALKAGVGTFVGFVLGGIGKIVCSIAMILVFLVDVLGGK